MEGTKLREALTARGVRQEDLAEVLGITQSAVSWWVRGKGRPSIEVIPALAAALDADSIDLALTWWPELAELDRLAEVRRITAGATAEQLSQLEATARRIMAAKRSARRSRTAAG